MKEILNTIEINGKKKEVKEKIYSINEFPFEMLLSDISNKKNINRNSNKYLNDRTIWISNNKKGDKLKRYLNVLCAFDIETTRLTNLPLENPHCNESFMYVWQMDFRINDFENKHYTVIGRTWEEYIEFMDNFSNFFKLNSKNTLVTYIHNLAYEFQFTRNIWSEYLGGMQDIFLMDRRKPAKLTVGNGKFEFRCSYLLSNRSLKSYCDISKYCVHKKLDGEEFDYSVYRSHTTHLSDKEYSYCVNDVRGLTECIFSDLQDNKINVDNMERVSATDTDDISTIPLTNTGYVRRMYREYCKNDKQYMKIFKKGITGLDYNSYRIMRGCFRGGNTHANRNYANKIIDNVKSYDLTSSYPSAMAIDTYPIGTLINCADDEIKLLNNKKYYNNMKEKYCLMMRIKINNATVHDNVTVPYIPVDKCLKLRKNGEEIHYINDNGRILWGDSFDLYVTEIDLDIILKQYDLDFEIIECIKSYRGYLPSTLINVMMNLYKLKTELKGVIGEEYNLMKAKNQLNSTYGMCVMDMVRDIVEFDEDYEDLYKVEHINRETATDEEKQIITDTLKQFTENNNSFLLYQWGVYVTANARKRLQDGIDLVGDDLIYCDTDSVKFKNPEEHDYKFETILNNQYIAKMDKIEKEKGLRCYALNTKNEKKYLALWDFDGHYNRFKTLGAKKYAYHSDDRKKDGTIEKDVFHITVSGLMKSASKVFKNIDNFKIGTIIDKKHNLHNTTAYFDKEKCYYLDLPNNERILTGSSLSVIPSDYQIGITKEYAEVLGEDITSITYDFFI